MEFIDISPFRLVYFYSIHRRVNIGCIKSNFIQSCHLSHANFIFIFGCTYCVVYDFEFIYVMIMVWRGEWESIADIPALIYINKWIWSRGWCAHNLVSSGMNTSKSIIYTKNHEKTLRPMYLKTHFISNYVHITR